MIMFMLLGFLFFIYGIKFCQLFHLRCSEINDVLINTLKTLIGYVLWEIFYVRYNDANKNNYVLNLLFI